MRTEREKPGGGERLTGQEGQVRKPLVWQKEPRAESTCEAELRPRGQ